MSTKLLKSSKRGADVNRLPVQMQKFVGELLADKSFNATNAARKAGYAHPSVAANKLMKNPIVLAHIGKAIHRREVRTEVTQDKVIKELAIVAFSNAQELFDKNDAIKAVKSMDENTARAIQSIKISYTTEGSREEPVEVKHVEVRFWSKTEALKMLAAHLGMTTDRLKMDGEIKIRLDYEALYKKPEQKTIVLDPVEYLIENPDKEQAPVVQPRYTVRELVEDEDG